MDAKETFGFTDVEARLWNNMALTDERNLVYEHTKTLLYNCALAYILVYAGRQNYMPLIAIGFTAVVFVSLQGFLNMKRKKAYEKAYREIVRKVESVCGSSEKGAYQSVDE